MFRRLRNLWLLSKYRPEEFSKNAKLVFDLNEPQMKKMATIISDYDAMEEFKK